MNRVVRLNFIAQFVQLLKRWLRDNGWALPWRTGPILLTNTAGTAVFDASYQVAEHTSQM